MINKVLWAAIALPALVSLLSCGSDESQSPLLPMEKPIFKLGYPKDDAQHALLAVTDSQLRVLSPRWKNALAKPGSRTMA